MDSKGGSPGLFVGRCSQGHVHQIALDYGPARNAFPPEKCASLRRRKGRASAYPNVHWQPQPGLEQCCNFA
jgi:hypothetical protein